MEHEDIDISQSVSGELLEGPSFESYETLQIPQVLSNETEGHEQEIIFSSPVYITDLPFIDLQDEEFLTLFKMSTNPGTSSTAPTLSSVNIGGDSYTLLSTKQTWTNVESGTLFKKTDRSTLALKDKTDLYQKFVASGQQKNFEYITMDIKDPNKLSDTHELYMSIRTLKAQHVRYDIHDVFNVVVDPSAPTLEFKSLYENYTVLTIDQVAASNEWYRTMIDTTAHPWIDENLTWSQDHLENHLDPAFHRTLLNDYEQFTAVQRGGPLLFIIMMKKLSTDTMAGAEHLKNLVLNLKISNEQGENVETICSQISAAYKRLQNVSIMFPSHGTASATTTNQNYSCIPADFPLSVIKIMKTSSVHEFTAHFDFFEKQHATNYFSKGPTTPLPSVDEILNMAKNLYNDLLRQGKWTGVSTQGSSTFLSRTDTKEVECFNCGTKGHHFKDCSKPKNNKLISERLAEMRKSRKNARKASNKDKDQDATTPSGKWAPPTAKENRKRLIDGKPMYWLTKSKKWVPDKMPPNSQGNPQGNVASTTSVAPVPTVVGPGISSDQSTVATSNVTTTTPQSQLAIANATRQMTEIISGLVNQTN